MVKQLTSIAGASCVIAVLVACSPRLVAEFNARLSYDDAPASGVLVAAEVTGFGASNTWVETDDRGDVILFASSSDTLFGPSRVLFAYADDLGLSVLIEGQDFEWRREGNTSGKEWLADFEADLTPLSEPRLRTCGTDGTITFEVDEVSPETTWMTVGTAAEDGIVAVECAAEDRTVTCPCPESITDRSFLVSRSVGESSSAEAWDGEITVDVIVELQLAP